MNREQVLAAFVKEFGGEDVLASPIDRASTGSRGSCPYVVGATGAFAVGLVGVAVVAPRRRRTTPRRPPSSGRFGARARDWTMSSATSIDDAGAARASSERRAAGTFSPGISSCSLSLLAASVAVLVAAPEPPENLILISLTIGAAGAAGVRACTAMLAPLRRPRRRCSSASRSAIALRADLEREKMLALRSIKELEFDRAMGKVSAQDFDEMAVAPASPRDGPHEAAR